MREGALIRVSLAAMRKRESYCVPNYFLDLITPDSRLRQFIDGGLVQLQ